MSDVEKNIGTHKPEFDGEWVRLGDVCEIVMGQSPDSSSYNTDCEGLPFYQGNADFGETHPTPRTWCSEPKKVAEPGDILISVRAPVGAINVADERCCIGRGLAAVRSNGAGISNAFLALILQSKRAYLDSMSTGSTFKAIGKKVLSSCEMPLYSREVQGRIACQVNWIDDCLRSSRRQLSALDDLVKSQFVEMFGDTYSNSKQLPSRKLGALIDFITSGSRGWSKYYSNEGDYFITIKNVRGCSISLDNVQHVHAPNNKEAERTKVQSGDVLISITADLGRTGVVSKEIADHGAYINQHLACIRLAGEDILPLYLSFFLESPGAKDQLQRKNQTGVKAGLNFDLVKSLDILVPPLALQQQFADFVARVDKLGFDVQQQIEKLETLKQSLMQEYFG